MDQEPLGRNLHSSCVVGKSFFIFGGIQLNQKGQKKFLNDLWAFSTRTGRWTEIRFHSPPRARFGGHLFYFEESFYIIGGTGEKKGTISIDKIKPEKGVLDSKSSNATSQNVDIDEFFFFETPSGNDIKEFACIFEKNGYFYSVGGTPNDFKHEKYILNRRSPDKNDRICITGCSESGKNTLFKNLCLTCPLIENKIHGELFEQEIEFEKNILYENIVTTLNMLIFFTKDKFEGNSKIMSAISKVEAIKRNQLLGDYTLYTTELANAVEELWQDYRVQEELRKRSFDINRGIHYLFENLPRYRSSNNLKLTNEDILHTFYKNVGFSSMKDERLIKIKGKNKNTSWFKDYKIIKVGGLRSERRKFIQKKTQESNCILVLVNLTHYLQHLYESGKVKRIDEDYSFFEEITNQSELSQKPIHLCFTMKDILPDLLDRYDNVKIADHYFKENNIQRSDKLTSSDFLEFIIWKFSNNIKRKRVYIHLLSCVDSNDVLTLGEAIHQSLIIDHYDTNLSKISCVFGKEKPFTRYQTGNLPFTDLIFK